MTRASATTVHRHLQRPSQAEVETGRTFGQYKLSLDTLMMYSRSMRIGDVTVHALPDGVMPMPPSVLYPDLPMSTWRNLPGTMTRMICYSSIRRIPGD